MAIRIATLRLGQQGVTSLEYAFLAGLVSLAIASAVATYGRKLGNSYSNIAAGLTYSGS